MPTIDGAYGEGGGQVLRTALTLAVLTGQPLRLVRIRANRRNPGLAPQHLTTVLALAAICNAEVEGACLHATDLSFVPLASPAGGEYTFDVAAVAGRGSAGSVTLIVQSLLLPLALAAGESHLRLLGGTHVPWSPPAEYLAEVYLPHLVRCGIDATVAVERCGFYPHGGGVLSAHIKGGAILRPIALETRGDRPSLAATAAVCRLPAGIGQRLLDRLEQNLGRQGLTLSDRTLLSPPSGGPGVYLWLRAAYGQGVAGFAALGEKGKPAEMVADEAAALFAGHHAANAPVDRQLADQLLLPLAVAPGVSRLRVAEVTRHLLTNAYVIGQFLPGCIEVHGLEGGPGRVVIHGGLPART
ncbi:MAG: RNA 3'-terminal phosphate cyclase [Thermodesulfobacteriota bacterium]|jgi:RNA 3'-terminal phosphate cyclase (ATP)